MHASDQEIHKQPHEENGWKIEQQQPEPQQQPHQLHTNSLGT